MCSRTLPVDLNENQPEAPAFFEPTPYDRTVGIIVNKNLYTSIKSSLDIYTADLSIIEGKKVWLCAETFDSTMPASQMRDSLIRHYIHDNLEGAILIGDLPVAWYEFRNDWQEGYTSFPIDLYFMDMDGKWFDTAKAGSWYGKAQAGVFDGLDVNGSVEIWISRIMASTMQGNEAEIVNAYFNRAHNRMMGNDSLPSRGLLFKYEWLSEDSRMEMLYPPERLKTYNNRPDNSKEDWMREIRNGYEYVRIVEHGSPNCNSFSDVGFFYQEYDNMARSSEGASNVRFYNLFSCDNSRYTQPNIGTYYALGQNGLISVGPTKIGGMIDCSIFHKSLANNESFGDAFKNWFNEYVFMNNISSDFEKIAYSYGMTLIGAGTLRLAPYSKNISHQIIVTKTQGGSINFEGRVMVPDGEKRTFEILPGQEYEIGSVFIDNVLTEVIRYSPIPFDDAYGRTYPQWGVLTLDAVHADHCIDVSFARRKEFKVSIKVDGCGYIHDNSEHITTDSTTQLWQNLFYEDDDVLYRIASKSYFCTISFLTDNGNAINGVSDTLVFDGHFKVHENHTIISHFEDRKVFFIRLSSEGSGQIKWLGSSDYLPDLPGSISQPRFIEGSMYVKKDSLPFALSSRGCLSMNDSTISAREDGRLVLEFAPDSNCILSHAIINNDTIDNDSFYTCFKAPCAIKYYYFSLIRSDYSIKAIFKSLEDSVNVNDTLQTSIN
jgi:hypothetical protein